MALIMVVEDNKKIRANTIFQLEDEGYETIDFGSAEQASAYLTDRQRPKPDILLLDVRLEGGPYLIDDYTVKPSQEKDHPDLGKFREAIKRIPPDRLQGKVLLKGVNSLVAGKKVYLQF